MEPGARWIFGYGSLVWRPAFEHVERAPAFVRGFARRFWQGSPDHRGVPHAPGRVVTLVARPGEVCGGLAYRVDERVWDGVVAALDERESGGFERHAVNLAFADRGRAPARALVYVAAEGNPNFLGPASTQEIVSQVRAARGRSGTNVEYVRRLAEALRALGLDDAHVFDLAARLPEAWE